jgi:sugar-specific transcriptional regulator TrmB
MTDSHANNGKILSELQELGFSEYEARAYLALLKLQVATAYEVSKTAGLPKANAYSVLDTLSQKQAVQPVSESPVRYVPVAPDILFERIATTTRRRCAKVIEQLPQFSHSKDQEYVWSLSGENAIHAKIEAMIDAATTHVWIKSAEALLEVHRNALERAANRGVSILIILFGDNPDRFRFGASSQTFLHEGNGIPVGIAPHLITITVDYQEALVAEFRGSPNGSYTRNTPIVNLADTLLRHEIYFAEIFEIFGQPIQKTFGVALINLRRKYLPDQQALDLEARLRRLEGLPNNTSNEQKVRTP